MNDYKKIHGNVMQYYSNRFSDYGHSTKFNRAAEQFSEFIKIRLDDKAVKR